MSSPIFRPLWIEGRKQFSSSKYTSISLPEWVDYEDASLCIKKLGYETAIFGSFARSEEALNLVDSIVTPFEKMRDLGVRIGIKVTFDIDLITESIPLSPHNRKFNGFIENELEILFNKLPPFDFLVYESLALIYDEMGLNEDTEHLISENARLEIAFLEKILGKRDLVYILPGEELRQEHFLKEIALDAGPKTWITFSSRMGNPFHDHLKIHPFLKNTDPQETEGYRLLSIVNIGGVLQGGGLWPTVALDLMHSLYPLMNDLGVVALPCVHGLPKRGSYLEAGLLISSKAAEGNCFPEKELLSWLRTFHQEKEEESTLRDLKEVRDICLQLSHMRTLLFEKSRDKVSQEETKLLAAGVFYRLKSLLKERNSSRDPSFQDYIHYFFRDASRIVLHFTQSFNITLQETFEPDSGKKGFWTEFTAGAGSGLRSLGKVSLCKTPSVDPDCKKMEAIYKDAGWF